MYRVVQYNLSLSSLWFILIPMSLKICFTLYYWCCMHLLVVFCCLVDSCFKYWYISLYKPILLTNGPLRTSKMVFQVTGVAWPSISIHVWSTWSSLYWSELQLLSIFTSSLLLTLRPIPILRHNASWEASFFKTSYLIGFSSTI